jgi:hypothetical protein
LSGLHDAEHDRRLEELWARGADPRAELAQSDLRDCAECYSTLDDMLSSEDKLNQAGAEFRKASEAAASLTDAPGEERIERFVREKLAGPEAQGAPVQRRWLRPALLAAALLLGIAIAILVSQDRGQAPVRLGGEGLTILAPTEAVESWGTFSWEAKLPENGWFELLIYDSAGAPTDAALLKSPPLTETRWSPSPELISKLPRRIRWEVRIYDPSSGNPDSSAFAEAWLSSS